jgi:hypothetical protein
MNKQSTLLPALSLAIGLSLAAPAMAIHDVHPVEHHGGAAAIGKKLADPTSDVWALFTEFDYSWNSGDLTDGRRPNQAMILQPIMPFKITKDLKMLTRPTLPVVSSQLPNGRLDDDGGADFSRYNGLGNMSLPLLLSPVTKKPFSWGLGPTLSFPTATRSELGTDTWEAGPTALGVYKTSNWTAVALAQYWWSYAEQGDNKNTSHGSLLYAFWYNLPNAWQVGTGPTITYNHKAESGNKLNLPVGLMFAKTTTFGKLPVKFQFGVEYSVQSEDAYGKEWLIKLNVIPVIASLQHEPFF